MSQDNRPNANDGAQNNDSSADQTAAAQAKRQLHTLAELINAREPLDAFVQLVAIRKGQTQNGRDFYKATFRDKRLLANAYLWKNTLYFNECEQNLWTPGEFYKIRAKAVASKYGAKLELSKIRPVARDDKIDGFEPEDCRPSSKTEPETLLSEILNFANANIPKGPLLLLVQRVYKEYRPALCDCVATRYHHHAYVGGLMEHTLSVAKLAMNIAEHFCVANPKIKGVFSKPLLCAGALLHDVGVVLAIKNSDVYPEHTIAGELIGQAILGVEIIQRFAIETNLDVKTRVQLEHLILANMRFRDWGAPIPPTTLEGMVLHYAEYADATFSNALKTLDEEPANEYFTVRNGPFGTPLFRPDAKL
ncbi:MAG: HD domain-containing protein [Planctomycetia bacterium]|nr:HD domain-containing protein [Planctomycetia bacterium]